MSMVGLSIAFTAGLLSFLSPCIVPMLSVYFSLITGQSFRSLQGLTPGEAVRKGALSSTLAFIAGFFIVFTAAGVVAAKIGALVQQSQVYLNLLGGAFVIVLGLSMAGILPQEVVQRITLRHREMEGASEGSRTWSSFLVGLFFAVACSHCIAPTLYAVLMYAGSTGSPALGGLLMALFSLGLAIPYLFAGLFFGRAVNLLKRAASVRPWVQRVAGLLVVLLGVVMMVGKLPWLTQVISSIWPYRPPVGM